MCSVVKSILKAPIKLTDKIISNNPISKKLEKKYGIRPQGLRLLGKAVGYQRPNRFYQPGGGGYVEGQKGSEYRAPQHSLAIAQYRKKQQGGGS